MVFSAQVQVSPAALKLGDANETWCKIDLEYWALQSSRSFTVLYGKEYT